MSVFDNQIMSLFSIDIFRQVMNGEPISMCRFNVLISLLISAGIPYDTSFSAGTRKEAPSIQLTIHINPTTTLVFVVPLGLGSTAFTPSP
ncbi:MAG: hypothetical protein FWE29_00020 [Defluviitaleaceae bacterium]|nr:hypothetical protein [Defluviitaleaceae bacterium]